MLFNSPEFLFAFLPATLVIFFLLARNRTSGSAIGWLVFTSLFFYGWWNPKFLVLIAISIVFNYTIGLALNRARYKPDSHRKFLLIGGIAANLVLLGYYKYANFTVTTLADILGQSWQIADITLPLGISFFTFTQIAFLVDNYRNEAHEYDFVKYCLFVTFFPHLIAGPVLHHKEMMPQFDKPETFRFSADNLAIGFTIFAIGLFKKVVLADGVAVFADPVFSASEQGINLTFFEAWVGALSYSFQLYFDFSGYSDMAVGLALMFNIILPINFNSPYKAINMIEFWRRWHMTLSRFLRDYLYIPLGGNKHGSARRYINLMLTMLLGGLWHGAGWTFVAWGFLHGVFLVINHGWQTVTKALRINTDGRASMLLARSITFLCVVIAWVPFRAETFGGASGILRGMAGLNGFHLNEPHQGMLNVFWGLGDWLQSAGVVYTETPYFGGSDEVLMLGTLFLISWFLPNTFEFAGILKRKADTAVGWFANLSYQRSTRDVWFVSGLIILTLMTMQSVQKAKFLYYDF